jgi:hypothetical protein
MSGNQLHNREAPNLSRPRLTPSDLVTELYEVVGVPILHVSLLLGVGQGPVRTGLGAAGVDLLPVGAGQDALWMERRRAS